MERLYSLNTSDVPMELPPGFRFHPTDEELITHYLSPKVVDTRFSTKAIGEVDLNKVEPWDLPWKAKMGEKEWYFFCIRDRKYPTGSRTNRATDAGYWKATGKDKEIFRAKTFVGMKKTLVFYKGRAPRGEKTNWVMHEYRLQGNNLQENAKNEWVISRIFKKSSGGKKVHISGLVKSRDFHSDLPPLMDLSSDEKHTRITSAVEGSHVTCFSNPTEDHQEKSVDKFSSSSRNSDYHHIDPFIFSKVPNGNSTLSSQNISHKGDLHGPDYVSLQDQSMKQNTKAEFSPDFFGANSEISSTICNYEVEFKAYEEDQEFQIGSVDFDWLWNY